MKSKRFLVAITLIASLAILPSAIAGEKSRAAGPSPTSVVNTILSGSSFPAKTLGINGDFYIDTKNLNLYGPKTKGVWKVTTSLRPKEPVAASVVVGDTGPAGSTGATGAQGVKGDAGAAGSSATSISYFVDLGSWMLATNQNLGPSDSSNFITLEAGSYTFNISVDGTFSPESSVAMYIGMQIIASGGSMDYQVFTSDSHTFINSLGRRHYQFMIIGKIVCTSSTTLKLRAVDQFGATSGNFLNFTGKALVNKVGSIG